jgi:hypothetical protein
MEWGGMGWNGVEWGGDVEEVWAAEAVVQGCERAYRKRSTQSSGPEEGGLPPIFIVSRARGRTAILLGFKVGYP